MKKLYVLLLFLSTGCFQAQAAYALKDGSQKEKKEKFALCGGLFRKFVRSERFKEIFDNIIFDENKCCKVLFNGDSGKYKAWLNTRIQHGMAEYANVGKKNYKITLKDALNKMRGKEFFAKERGIYVDELIKKLPFFFYEDLKRNITWDSKIPFDYGDSICLRGFIELLTMLLRPNFYFETYNEDFAIRSRIFVVVYFTLLFEYAAEIQNDLAIKL